MYTPAVFAKRFGVLPVKRTITNRRYYTDEDLVAALRLPRVQKRVLAHQDRLARFGYPLDTPCWFISVTLTSASCWS